MHSARLPPFQINNSSKLEALRYCSMQVQNKTIKSDQLEDTEERVAYDLFFPALSSNILNVSWDETAVT